MYVCLFLGSGRCQAGSVYSHMAAADLLEEWAEAEEKTGEFPHHQSTATLHDKDTQFETFESLSKVLKNNIWATKEQCVSWFPGLLHQLLLLAKNLAALL